MRVRLLDMNNHAAVASNKAARSRLSLFFAALTGATCACASVACDDPTDPEALAALAADEAAEEFTAEEPPPAAGGFAVTGLAAADFVCGKAVTTCAAPPAPTWCATYGILADSASIPKLYRDIMQAKCKANTNNACYECWDLANYCSQVGTNCAGLQDRCTCMAHKLGEI